MIISSFIIIQLLLFFGEILPRDLLVEGMKNGSNRGTKKRKDESGPSRQFHPDKIRAGTPVLKHQPNAFSLTELSFLIRILEMVEENELEQNIYSIQQILFGNGIDILRKKHILNQGQLAHLIWGNQNNTSEGHFNHLMRENQGHLDSEQTAHINETNSDQILHTIGEISGKIGKLITMYEGKLNDAMMELNGSLKNVGNKTELIKLNKSRYYELTDSLNEGDKANQILKNEINSNHSNNVRINEANLSELLHQANPSRLRNLLKSLLEPTQLEKNIYIFYNLLVVARALTSMFMSNVALTTFYHKLLSSKGYFLNKRVNDKLWSALKKQLDFGKYQQVLATYENKIAEAINKLTAKGKSTTFSLLIQHHQDYFFDVVLQLLNRILSGTFPGLNFKESYENVNTIGYYAGIIFTVNDESFVNENYTDGNENDYEFEPGNYYTDDEEGI